MKSLTNGQLHTIIGEDEENLQENFENFMSALESETTEFTIIGFKPAIIAIICAGDPVYEETEEPEPEGPEIDTEAIDEV